jgi:hypothetical protein
MSLECANRFKRRRFGPARPVHKRRGGGRLADLTTASDPRRVGSVVVLRPAAPAAGKRKATDHPHENDPIRTSSGEGAWHANQHDRTRAHPPAAWAARPWPPGRPRHRPAAVRPFDPDQPQRDCHDPTCGYPNRQPCPRPRARHWRHSQGPDHRGLRSRRRRQNHAGLVSDRPSPAVRRDRRVHRHRARPRPCLGGHSWRRHPSACCYAGQRAASRPSKSPASWSTQARWTCWSSTRSPHSSPKWSWMGR